MKEERSKKGSKQIIIITVMIMLCNFIMPNFAYAAETNGGGKLFIGIAQFICFIPDTVINFLQDMFVSPRNIYNESTKKYEFLYSPGTIFAGTVPAFDINFITANKDDNKLAQNEDLSGNINDYIKTNQEKYRSGQTVNKSEYDEKLKKLKERGYDGIIEGGFNSHPNRSEYEIYYYIDDNSTEKPEDDILIIETFGRFGTKSLVSDSIASVRSYYNHTYKENFYDGDNEYKSTAFILQDLISTWYNALRRIALVGLLSVLVYIGIRIVLTSTSAKEKAKYKSMLKDWLIALCILFTLHYVMNITITVVEKVNEVIGASSIGQNGEDILMSTIRNDIAQGDESWKDVIVQDVLYCVLGVYTIIFTIQYLRRVIYLAFLTIIAPLITLTYPLDKIKDKKSQAFDMWLKDYIFFSLLQVVHLLIYYVLVGSSMDLADNGSWLFAIVAIGFLTKAEKIVKKMFGFEKSKTMGALAAGATGALVMNAINKISHKSSKGGKTGGNFGSSGGSSNSNVRTATTNPLGAITGGAGGNASGLGAQGNGGTLGTSGASRKFYIWKFKTKR